MRGIEPIRLDAHVGASAAEATRMALPPQDPRLPRVPSWLFIAFTAWVAFIAYIAQIRHIWWGYAGSAATIVVALALRKRWRAPASVEHAAARREEDGWREGTGDVGRDRLRVVRARVDHGHRQWRRTRRCLSRAQLREPVGQGHRARDAAWSGGGWTVAHPQPPATLHTGDVGNRVRLSASQPCVRIRNVVRRSGRWEAQARRTSLGDYLAAVGGLTRPRRTMQGSDRSPQW